MTRLNTVHLLDDMAFGGVTRALTVFEDPRIAGRMASRILQVDPRAFLANRLNAQMIVIHFTPRWRALPFLASLRARNPAARIVHIEHSYTRAWAAHHVRRPARFAAMLRSWYRLCDEVIAVSRGQADWLRGFLAADRAPRVIHPWSGEQDLGRVPLPIRRDGGPLRLAAFGRFAEQKGFDTLVKAVRMLPRKDFTLDLGGFGPDEALLRVLAREVPHTGDDPQVRFVGRVDNVAAFLAEADIVVVPSRWEAFGQVVAEAMLAGRPVLVADVDGMPEQVRGHGWIADCSTAESLARAIRQLDRLSFPAVGKTNRAAMAGAEAARIDGWVELIRSAQSQAVAAAGPGRLRASH